MHGLRVGVTATRKSMQLVAALELRGADVLSGPMLSGDVAAPDDDILADTATIIAAQPTWVVATTGVGMVLWLEAADRGGLGPELRACLVQARCVARGAKAVGGLANAGVKPVWVSPRETDADVAGWLANRVLDVDSIAVQLHGGRTHAYRHVANLGADVVTVMPYQTGPPDDVAPAQALIRAIIGATVDVVTFTSPSAARNLFAIAEDLGPDVLAEVRQCLAGQVAVASIGPVTSEALEEQGASVTITPRRYRTGDLIRAIETWASSRGGRAGLAGGPGEGAAKVTVPTQVGATSPEIRLLPASREVAVAGRVVALGPREYDLLATLLRSRGVVFRTTELLERIWGHDAPQDDAAVRHQVSRLRRKLQGTGLQIQTVRGVGYRLQSLA